MYRLGLCFLAVSPVPLAVSTTVPKPEGLA